jgi:ATP-dependent Clp protease ATP-binding subunit ClpA
VRTRSALTDITTINALLTGAENLARDAGEKVPGAELLVISALALPDGTARRAFARVGADPDEFSTSVTALPAAALRAAGLVTANAPAADIPAAGTPAVAHADSTSPDPDVTPVNASAQQAFQVAVRLSKATKPSQLLGAHVILAICQMKPTTAVRALRSMGVDLDLLRAAAAEELRVKS